MRRALLVACDSHLLVLQFNAHHSEGVVGSIVVDVDSAEALLPRLDGHPFLTGIIVDHHRGPCLADTLFTGIEEGEREHKIRRFGKHPRESASFHSLYCQR